MSGLLVQLIPAALVGALAPLPITMVITLLMSDRGLAKALGFGLALVGVFAIVGAIALASAGTNAGETDTGSAVTGTIVAVLGALLLLTAVKHLLDAPDPDAPPPKFMTKLDTMGPPAAAVLGAVIALVNFKQLGIYLGGVSQIVAAEVSTGQSWVALVVLLVVIQAGVIGAIGTYVVARAWATRVLQGFQGWLVAHNRVISIALGLVIGAWFVVKGITQIA
jgi:Sap, sulfolipid-1-addressing protein